MKKLSKDKNELEAYLKNQGWLKPDEQITKIEKPGEGNMNFTLRVDTGERTIIVKQSRDYVEKYPQVAAPDERVLCEARFYEILSGETVLKAMTPNVIGLDKENRVMIMEDLGEGSDYSRLYKKEENIDEKELELLVDFAADLHKTFQADKVDNPIRNREMRFLNYEHIFVIPFLETNGINLNEILPGLSKIAETFKADKTLHEAVRKIGERYLADGPALLHGDFFPGSWLMTDNGIKVIDPEFCFFGDPEFEVGVMCAHLKMADQPVDLIEKVLKRYSAKAKIDRKLTEKYAATEILRRILGLAQLPLEIDLNKRKELMEEASHTLKGI